MKIINKKIMLERFLKKNNFQAVINKLKLKTIPSTYTDWRYIINYLWPNCVNY